MKLGLLLCDHVDERFRSTAGDIPDMFARWLPADWQVFDLTAGQFPELTECEGWVATGSRYSVYDEEDWIHRYSRLTREIHARQVPYLGVCFGHQMIGHALGGAVRKSSRGWGVGVHQFEVKSSEPWMAPPQSPVSLLMSCQDQIEELPSDGAVLASSAHCPKAIVRCGTLLGIQGHPEWEPAYAEALLHARRERIGAATVDAALATLDQSRDSAVLAGWVRRWLQSK